MTEITIKVVLVFFVVNLLRIDLYDVVKEIKKGREIQ
jgi:ABC-2 type transport system permease protein